MSNQASRCRFPQRGAGAVHASLMAEGPIFRWAYALQAKSTRRAGKRTLGMAIPLLTSGWGLASSYQKRRAHFLSLALGGRATRASHPPARPEPVAGRSPRGWGCDRFQLLGLSSAIQTCANTRFNSISAVF
jgi:hypothetical protein